MRVMTDWRHAGNDNCQWLPEVHLVETPNILQNFFHIETFKWLCCIKFDVVMALNTFWSSGLWSLFWEGGPTPGRIVLSPVKIQVNVETVYVAEELVATYQTLRLHDVEDHNTVLIYQGKFYLFWITQKLLLSETYSINSVRSLIHNCRLPKETPGSVAAQLAIRDITRGKSKHA
jgi:hypothetical protein